MNGTDLLAVFRNTGSEEAFRDLMRRYTNLVYSAAKRRLFNAALAEEVSQTVFTRLANTGPKLRPMPNSSRGCIGQPFMSQLIYGVLKLAAAHANNTLPLWNLLTPKTLFGRKCLPFWTKP